MKQSKKILALALSCGLVISNVGNVFASDISDNEDELMGVSELTETLSESTDNLNALMAKALKGMTEEERSEFFKLVGQENTEIKDYLIKIMEEDEVLDIEKLTADLEKNNEALRELVKEFYKDGIIEHGLIDELADEIEGREKSIESLKEIKEFNLTELRSLPKDIKLDEKEDGEKLAEVKVDDGKVTDSKDGLVKNQKLGFNINFVADAKLKKGETKIEKQGEFGLKEVKNDGKSEEVTKEPSDETIRVGIGEEKLSDLINQGGDGQTIIVNKDKADEINIDNSDVTEVLSDGKSCEKKIVKDLCDKSEKIEKKLSEVDKTKSEEKKEETKENKEKDTKKEESKTEVIEVKKPLEKPMQDTGVVNELGSVSFGSYAKALLSFLSFGLFGRFKKD